MSRPHTDPAELVDLGEHRRGLLRRISTLEPIVVPLGEAHRCVLAEDVAASEPVPSFASSAVDGYAVALPALQPGAELEVVAEVAAGAVVDVAVRPGAAIRIMTGAPVPSGTDAIVPVEHVEERERIVVVHEIPEPGAHVRPAGESAQPGEVVLCTGRLLDAPAIGMLAALGRPQVLVHPLPRVGILSTGDELVEPDAPLRPGQIRDTNSWALAAAVREAGAVPFRISGVRDDPAAIREAVEGALLHVDALVSTGGVSAGRYDHVKGVLAELGDVAFTKVAMKPGMPQAFGFVGDVPCFGLPGNPVSALVSFEVFVRPAIRRMQGRGDLTRRRVIATLADPLSSPQGKTELVRVRLERRGPSWLARSTGAQGSGILRSMVEADGLAEIPAGQSEVAAGEAVTVHLLRDM